MPPPSERVRLVARLHGVVLAPALARALPLAAVGGGLVVLGWPATPAGAVALALAAAIALRAVWRWERTRLLVTSERLVIVTGTLRRTRAEVPLARVRTVEIEQGVLGRLLGYGTLVAGDLEVPYVPDPRTVAELAGR
ncbi:MAG: PH domain-containing protein [Thermoleophilia bacterium]|nr:PH domain-containing protein [Thermoleophilia bacterium]